MSSPVDYNNTLPLHQITFRWQKWRGRTVMQMQSSAFSLTSSCSNLKTVMSSSIRCDTSHPAEYALYEYWLCIGRRRSDKLVEWAGYQRYCIWTKSVILIKRLFLYQSPVGMHWIETCKFALESNLVEAAIMNFQRWLFADMSAEPV